MSYTVKGTIIVIGEKQMFDAGSGKLTFRIDTGEAYSNILEFELFKGASYVEHLDNFTKFNKVGDAVEVEFNLKTNLWTNPKTQKESLFTSLSCWKVEKAEGVTHSESQPSTPTEVKEDISDLPF